MAKVYPSSDELLNTESVELLTREDLRKITWDYNENSLAGLFKNTPIMMYLFEVKKWEYSCEGEESIRSPLTIQRCNIEEGWIEFMEVTGDPWVRKDGTIIFPGQPVIDADECIVKTKIDCSMIVDILDTKGNVIVTLS